MHLPEMAIRKIASMENGCRKYPIQNKRYFGDENKKIRIKQIGNI